MSSSKLSEYETRYLEILRLGVAALEEIADELQALRKHLVPREEAPGPEGALITQTDEDFALMEELERSSGVPLETQVPGFGANLLDGWRKEVEGRD